jgi:hypothetical protein
MLSIGLMATPVTLSADLSPASNAAAAGLGGLGEKARDKLGGALDKVGGALDKATAGALDGDAGGSLGGHSGDSAGHHGGGSGHGKEGGHILSGLEAGQLAAYFGAKGKSLYGELSGYKRAMTRGHLGAAAGILAERSHDRVTTELVAALNSRLGIESNLTSHQVAAAAALRQRALLEAKLSALLGSAWHPIQKDADLKLREELDAGSAIEARIGLLEAYKDALRHGKLKAAAYALDAIAQKRSLPIEVIAELNAKLGITSPLTAIQIAEASLEVQGRKGPSLVGSSLELNAGLQQEVGAGGSGAPDAQIAAAAEIGLRSGDSGPANRSTLTASAAGELAVNPSTDDAPVPEVPAPFGFTSVFAMSEAAVPTERRLFLCSDQPDNESCPR